MTNIYTRNILNFKISVDFKDVNSNIYQLLEKKLKKKYEGLCIEHGYIKPDTMKLVTYSSGELYANYVSYDVIVECLVANAVEGMEIECIVKSITKVGIKAEINDTPSPFIIFIARDHHYDSHKFSKVEENNIISIRVIGQRYELYNKFIAVIAELIDIKSQTNFNEIKNKVSVKKKKKI